MPKNRTPRRTGHRLQRAVIAPAALFAVLVTGTLAPLSVAAAEGDVPLSVYVDPDVVKAREDLTKAEADAAAIMAEAEAKAAEDLAKAHADYADALAKIDADLADAATKDADAQAKAQIEAAEDLAKADENLAKAEADIAEDLAHAQANADKKITDALAKVDEAMLEAQRAAAGDPDVVKALEDLATAEAEAAAIMADAEAKAAEDLAKADTDYADALAKIDADLADAATKDADAQAKAELDAADALAKADENLAKAEADIAEDLAHAQANADKKITDAQTNLGEANVKAQERADKLAAELADVCSSSYGYDAERTIGSMYNINRFIGADDAWEDGSTGAGIDVAVIDTGTVPVEGLDGRKVIYGPDFSLESPDPAVRQLDTYGHGTHMAGIIAGNDHDTEDEVLTPGEFQGVAPDARIVSLKVADASGAVDPSQVIAAIDWVIAHRNDNGMNIRVINLSYRASSDQPYTIDPLARAVENAWDAGIVVVAAAGNDGDKSTRLANPAYDPYVIAVSALLEEEQKDGNKHCLGDSQSWKTTDYANNVNKDQRQPDIYAPGSTVVSLRNPGSFVDQAFPGSIISDRHTKGTGTSQAAAIVSGAVAVLLEARPELTPDEVKAVLVASAHEEDKVPALDLEKALIQPVPADATQTWPRSSGLGSLEATRGGAHVMIDGQPLTGEHSVVGPWDPETWLSTDDTTWTGATWTGATWTGATWTGATWTGATWTGATWTGGTWTGATWTGGTWT